MKTLVQFLSEAFEEVNEKKIFHTPEFLKKKAKRDAERAREEKAEELERERQRRKRQKDADDDDVDEKPETKDDAVDDTSKDDEDETVDKNPEPKDADEDKYADNKQEPDAKFFDNKKKDASLNNILSSSYDDITFDSEPLPQKATPKTIKSYEESYRTTNEKLKKRYEKEDDEIAYQRRAAKDALTYKRELEDERLKKQNDARIAYKKESLTKEEFAEWSKQNDKIFKRTQINLSNSRQEEDEKIKADEVEYDDKVSKKRKAHDKSLKNKFVEGLGKVSSDVKQQAKNFLSDLWSGDHTA